VKDLEIDADDTDPLCVMSSVSGEAIPKLPPGYWPKNLGPQFRCQYGTPRELNLMGDRKALRLCFGRVDATTQKEKDAPCPMQYTDVPPPCFLHFLFWKYLQELKTRD
jgi:hypothetical protein